MNKKEFDKVYINHQIKFGKVLCINADNSNLGIIPLAEALALASSQNLDLVQVAPPNKERIPTCKILNYGKLKYDNSKKKKESERKQRESVIKEKELVFRPTTGLNDLKTKAKKAIEFLSEGTKLRISIRFKGREIAHKNLALETLNEFIKMLPEVQVLNAPSMDGKFLTVLLVKKEEVK